ncbi:tetratricopeptide repeat protein [Breznakiellaceae bacterium SP9]
MKKVITIVAVLLSLSLNAAAQNNSPAFFALKMRAVKFFHNRDYAQALPLLEEMYALSPSTDGMLENWLGFIYQNLGEYSQAVSFYLEAKDIYEHRYGTDNIEYATALNNLGLLYRSMSDYDTAESYYLEALAVLKRAQLTADPLYSTLLNNFGMLYLAQGDYVQAEPYLVELNKLQGLVLSNNWGGQKRYNDLERKTAESISDGDYDQALPLLEKLNRLALSEDGWTENWLGYLYQEKGNYAQAVPFYLKSKDLRDSTLGKEKLAYAESLNNLAVLYERAGELERAKRYYIEAQELYRQTLGEENSTYAATLNNLALLYKKTSDYTRSEVYNREAMGIYERTLGRETPEYATALNNLGLLYLAMGDKAKAQEKPTGQTVQTQSVSASPTGQTQGVSASTTVETQDVSTIATAQPVQELKESEKLYKQAEEKLEESAALYKKESGAETAEYGKALTNLAALYKSTGNTVKAERLQRDGTAILENAIAKEYSDLRTKAKKYWDTKEYAKALLEFKKMHRLHQSEDGAVEASIASIYKMRRDYKQAQTWYLEALSIIEHALGKETIDYVAALNNLAEVYYLSGDTVQSERNRAEAIRLNTRVQEIETQYAVLQQQTQALINAGKVAEALDFMLQQHKLKPSKDGSDESSLASLYAALEDYKQAEKYYLESRDIVRRTVGQADPAYSSALTNLAQLYITMKEFDKADPLFKELKALAKAAAGLDETLYFVYTEALNIRSGPSFNYTGLGILNRGTPVNVLERDGTWWKITNGELTGYVNSKYLWELDRLGILPPAAHYVSAKALNVRSGPSADDDKVGELTQNISVNVIEQHGDWWWVKNGDLVGYVNSKYLGELDPITGLPPLVITTEPPPDLESFGVPDPIIEPESPIW